MHSNLAQAALVLQKIDVKAIRQFLGSTPSWSEEPGLRYMDCRSLIERFAAPMFNVHANDLLADIHFELLELDKGLRPHYHNESESVLFLPNPSLSPGYDMAIDHCHSCVVEWLPLDHCERMTCYVPAGLVHGFRRRSLRRGKGLLIVAASWPPIQDNDTFYVDA